MCTDLITDNSCAQGRILWKDLRLLFLFFRLLCLTIYLHFVSKIVFQFSSVLCRKYKNKSEWIYRDSFWVLPVLIAELRISSAPHREQKQFSPFPLSLSVTQLPKLNLIDAEVLSYALILLIIICHAAEEGGQIQNAPECVSLIVAKRERERKTWNT